jgi:hypothetical protein
MTQTNKQTAEVVYVPAKRILQTHYEGLPMGFYMIWKEFKDAHPRFYTAIIAAMEEYANQFKPLPLEEIKQPAPGAWAKAIEVAYTKGWQDRAMTGDRNKFNEGAFEVRLNEFLERTQNGKCLCDWINKFERRANSACPVHYPPPDESQSQPAGREVEVKEIWDMACEMQRRKLAMHHRFGTEDANFILNFHAPILPDNSKTNDNAK